MQALRLLLDAFPGFGTDPVEPASARDTVETDTPAAWATSAMVVRGMVGWLLRVDYAGGRLPATASLYHDTLLL